MRAFHILPWERRRAWLRPDIKSRRYGFAYGTLPEHAETGEERFTVEWADDDSVWYDVLAFSREKHLLARIGYPFTRMLQSKLRSDSGRAMQAAVSAER